ncbi:hypothetical protein F5X99DRAFT_398506 [Biscogniauxia marginata]|nr:hypothetical protein F5X99DRAFT_398506 [Biscogniauxia marginata]
MTALEESHLPVDKRLDIFGSTTGCSVTYDAFLSLNLRFHSEDNFRSLKKLSDPIIVPRGSEEAIIQHNDNHDRGHSDFPEHLTDVRDHARIGKSGSTLV